EFRGEGGAGDARGRRLRRRGNRPGAPQLLPPSAQLRSHLPRRGGGHGTHRRRDPHSLVPDDPRRPSKDIELMQVNEWLSLCLRWLHIIAGAAWIGTSFYFNWLNNNIRPPETPEPRVKGELWSVH